LYDEYEPRRMIRLATDGRLSKDESDPTATEFLLNFDAMAGPISELDVDLIANTDGNDVIFGDLGNDWLVGGTGQDHIYGGRGADLLNVDDDHTTDAGLNESTDNYESYADIAYGGAGRDVLIANTARDRLIDWAGEFNSYIVPFAAFGAPTISRGLPPGLFDYLYALSASDGADPTRSADTGSDPARNGEPEGELGLVLQKDLDWHDQTGAPDDPQPGNIPGGPRDVIQRASFNTNTAESFGADSGVWSIEGGRLEMAPEAIGDDAVSVLYVEQLLPGYFEMQATVNAGKPTGGLKSNAYLIFDYQSPTDFKFAGINVSIDKLQMGYRDAAGWHVEEQTNAQLKPNTDYNMLLAINGVTATLVVDNEEVFGRAFDPRIDADGFSYGLNSGMVGIGGNNSIARIDNVAVQILPPEITLEEAEDFGDGAADLFTGGSIGQWQVVNRQYEGVPSTGEDSAISMIELGVGPAYLLKLETSLNTEAMGGLIFDRNANGSFKFAAINADTNEATLGHYTQQYGWVVDATRTVFMDEDEDSRLTASLQGTTVSVSLNDQPLLGYVYNAVVVDGAVGLLTRDGATTFDTFRFMTSDPAVAADSTASADPSSMPVVQAEAAILDMLFEDEEATADMLAWDFQDSLESDDEEDFSLLFDDWTKVVLEEYLRTKK